MTTIGTGMMQAFTLHKHGIRSYKQLSIMLPILAIYSQFQSPFYGWQEEAIEWLAKWILELEVECLVLNIHVKHAFYQ